MVAPVDWAAKFRGSFPQFQPLCSFTLAAKVKPVRVSPADSMAEDCLAPATATKARAAGQATCAVLPWPAIDSWLPAVAAEPAVGLVALEVREVQPSPAQARQARVAQAEVPLKSLVAPAVPDIRPVTERPELPLPGALAATALWPAVVAAGEATSAVVVAAETQFPRV